MPVRAVVFDLFDTLVDLHMEQLPVVEVAGRRLRSTHRALHAVIVQRAEVEFETFAETLLAVDSELRERSYARGLELPTIERFGELVRRLQLRDPELPEALTRTHMQAIVEQARYLGHHADVLAELGREHRLAVCSNFSHTPTAERVLREAGLRPALDAVVISEQFGIRKPRPEIFEAVLGELGVAPEEAVHVGDSLSADVDGAARLGLRTVWVTRRIADAERALEAHSGATPDWIVADLAELPALIETA